MDLPRLVALDEQCRKRAQSGLDEVVMDDRRREQARHRRPLGRRVPVGDEQHPVPFAHGGLRGLREPRARVLEPLRRVEGRVDPDDGKFVEGGRVEEEALQLDARRVLGRFHEQRAAGAEQRGQRHHEPLADVVDRRVRHLREPLAEIAEERPRTPGERREGGVVAHRGGRLVSVGGGRAHDHRQLFACVPEEDMSGCQVLLRRRSRFTDGRFASPLFEPAPVWSRAREPQLDRSVLLEAAVGVDGEHLPRPEPSPTRTCSGRHVEDTRLGGAANEIAGNDEAKRAKAVAVESRADGAAVREDDARWSVPRLDQTGVEAMEVPHLRVELGISLPGGRNQHRQRMARVAAAAHQQLERVVEHARVGALLLEDRPVDTQGQGTGAHPVDVAADRIDLSVVAKEPERLRPLPRRLGIRREALVEDAEPNLDGRVAQVGIERSELIGRAQRLVDDRAKRERRDVEVVSAVEALAGAEGSRLDRLVVPRGRLEQRLLDCRD